MSSVAIYLQFSLYFLGQLLFSDIDYKLYLGVLCTTMVVVIVAVVVTCFVTWKRRNEKILIGLRQMAGRRGEESPRRPDVQATELRHIPSTPQQQVACCGCGSEGCGGGCEVRVEIVPHPHPCRQLKKATSQGDLTMGSCDQPEWEDHTHNTNSVAVTSNEAYGRGGSTPATPPVPRAPPPPYPGTARGNQSNVRSIHEYDYIGDRS